eukprot:UN33563
MVAFSKVFVVAFSVLVSGWIVGEVLMRFFQILPDCENIKNLSMMNNNFNNEQPLFDVDIIDKNKKLEATKIHWENVIEGVEWKHLGNSFADIAFYNEENVDYVLKGPALNNCSDPKYHLAFQRELWAYSTLRNQEIAPEVVYFNEESCIFIMEHAGERIDHTNKPENAFEQSIKIIKRMRHLNISHNDIKDSEIFVKNDKIYLLDYGWSTEHWYDLFNQNKPYFWGDDQIGFYQT